VAPAVVSPAGLISIAVARMSGSVKRHMDTITTSDGVDIFFKDWGSGPPIVFSHGWRVDREP